MCLKFKKSQNWDTAQIKASKESREPYKNCSLLWSGMYESIQGMWIICISLPTKPTVQTSNVHSCHPNFVADFMSEMHSLPASFSLLMVITMYTVMLRVTATHNVAKPWQPKLKNYISPTQMLWSLHFIIGQNNM